jgi:hypothetical protein
MSTHLQLHWVTESRCDLGTPLEAESLDAAIRERVLALAGAGRGSEEGPLMLRLPFFDRRESRRRAEILRSLQFVREGNVIRTLPLTQSSELRDRAAMLLATHPSWISAPDELQDGYFRTWQKVSTVLQNALRRWIPELYFRDAARYEDRERAYPLLVYAASRICHGRPRTEFTYDIADPEALTSATHMIGRALQAVLKRIESELQESGRPELARRYAPIWHEDVLRAVRKKPRPYLSLLADEAVLINAVIALGTARGMEAVKPFTKAAHLALRSVLGEDMRSLAARALEEATQVLENEKHQAA